jgi:hypothetical protein
MAKAWMIRLSGQGPLYTAPFGNVAWTWVFKTGRQVGNEAFSRVTAYWVYFYSERLVTSWSRLVTGRDGCTALQQCG